MTKPQVSAGSRTVRRQVLAQLKKCYDPEIPINLVDLGLIYSYSLKKNKKGKYDVLVIMTLTTPACSMGDVICKGVAAKIRELSKVATVKIKLVFEPAWTPACLSKTARLQLGLVKKAS